MEAAIIGLTEGVLTLQTVEAFLIDTAGVSAADAKNIKRAVASIPIGAQASLSNFGKIPAKNSVFKNKRDLYPIEVTKEEKGGKKGKGMWKK